MSLYQKIAQVGPKLFGKARVMKHAFNLSPMYRRSTAKILWVSEDVLDIKIKLPISYKNRNYVGSIFGGSMFSAVDPIPMVQLINLLDSQYVVWDKAASIKFKAPAKEDMYAHFQYTNQELEEIKKRVLEEKELELVKTTELVNQSGDKVYCVIEKTLYISSKEHYRNKRKMRESKQADSAV